MPSARSSPVRDSGLPRQLRADEWAGYGLPKVAIGGERKAPLTIGAQRRGCGSPSDMAPPSLALWRTPDVGDQPQALARRPDYVGGRRYPLVRGGESRSRRT